MENDEIIVENFFRYPEPTHLMKSDLGWTKRDIADARSDDSETIFRYHIEEVGFSMSLFCIDDREIYIIDLEKSPIEIRKCNHNPEWDGEYELFKFEAAGDHHADGEIICTFDDASKIWDNLVINGMHLSELISRSAILDIG